MIFEMVMGCSYSGKTTYAKQRQIADWVKISDDRIKDMIQKSFPNITDKEIQIEMIQRSIAFMKAGRNIVFDAKNLTAEERIEILNQIKEIFGRKSYYYLVFVDTPKDICIKRSNRYINKKTPKEVIDQEFIDLEKPSYVEGWDIIKTITPVKEEV